MRKKFAGNLIFLIAINLLVKPFWIFGIDRVVQNQAGAALYGTYFAVFNYTYIFSILLDFGINNFNNRAVSRHQKRAGEYLFNLLLLKVGLAIVYFALTFVSAFMTGFSSLQIQMLVLLAVNQILLSYILYLRSNLAALQHFKIDAAISVLDKLLAIILCSVVLYTHFFPTFDLMNFIYAQTISLFITAFVAYLALSGKTTFVMQFWRAKYFKLILFKSAPFAMLALLMGIYYRIDAVMLERMLEDGAKETGIYAASFRLLDAVNQFGFLFATPLFPLFANMLRKRENTEQLLKFSAVLMFVFSVSVSVLCWVYSKPLMQLQYTEANDYYAVIFGWLMLTFIPMSSIYIFGTLLTANGSLMLLNKIAIAGIVCNVGLNLFLIPAYGAFGTTIATLITQVLVAGIHILACNRKFQTNWEWNLLIRLGLFTGAGFGFVFLLSRVVDTIFVSLPLSAVVLLGLIFIFRLIPMDMILRFVRQPKSN